jgi:hypothetical protein
MEAIKYIVANSERILTYKGFKHLDKINQSTIRLFNSVSDARLFLDKHVTYYRLPVEFKKVRVSYEVIE